MDPQELSLQELIKLNLPVLNPFSDLINKPTVSGKMHNTINGSNCIEFPQPVNPSKNALKSYLMMSS